MSNNIAVSITADVADLTAKRAILSAELKAATKDLNDFAATAKTSGLSDSLKTSMLASAEAVAKNRAQIGLLDKDLRGHVGHVGNTREAYEALRVTQDLLSGDFVRAGAGVVRLGERMAAHAGIARLMAGAMSPLGLAVLAVTGATIAAVAATAVYEEAQHQLLVSTVGVGAASGASADQINALSTKNFSLKSSVNDNVKAMEAYAAAGVRNTTTLQALSATTSDFAALTGQKAKDAVKELAEAMKDPEKGAEKLNEQLSFLNSTQLREIQTLAQLGDKTKAQALLVAALKERDDEAARASGGLGGEVHTLGVVFSDLATFIGKANDKLNEFNILATGGSADVAGAKARAAQVQRTAGLKADSAAGAKLEDDTPEGRAQAERNKLQGDVNTVSRALAADTKLHGEHSAAVAADRQALAEYSRALSTYLTPVQKKIAADGLDVKIAEAKHAKNKQLVADLTTQKSLIEQAGVVESAADAAALAKGAGEVGSAHGGGGGAKKPKDDVVAQWSQQLHAQEIASGEFFKDQTQAELAFWQSKLAMTTEGSKDWLDVQSKIFDAAKTIAHQEYDARLATLNDELEAAKGSWSREQALWAEKLAFIRSKFGEQSAEYQNAHRELEAAERQHQETMLQIQREKTTQALAELRNNLDTAKTIRDQDARTAEALAQASAQSNPLLGGVKAAQQEAAIHQAALQQQMAADQAYHAAEVAAKQQEIDAFIQANQTETAAYKKALGDRHTLDVQYANSLKVLQSQMANQAVQDQLRIRQAWQSTIDPIVSSAGSAMKGLINGTTTWKQALLSVAGSIEDVVVQALEKIVETQILNAIVGKTTAQSTILANAAVAGSAGVASFAAAPFPIDTGAPAFGQAMFAAAASFGVASAAGGYDIPAGTNPLTQLHAEEMVLPAHIANPLREAIGGAGTGGRVAPFASAANGNTAGDVHNHFHVHAVDTKGMERLLQQHGGTLAKIMHEQVKRQRASR